ncbi:hypothetical protein D1O33_25245 (plasmid) [Rhodococcus rhodochrous]|nr:hypothetical protein C6369_002125 [Rhodococcus rhodochrous]OWY80173.1 hypothetical protein B9C99_18885 [Rhodococcus sp. BUPNP1]QHG85344.1 hypothetical protein D1O33_25245 [Rhodococcus rhodochrous]QOH59566.1 hypothetical protein C6Y44_26090 [Rhodococcus rhodochrous]
MQFDIRTSATRTCAPTPIARSVANTEPSGATRFTGQILHQFPIGPSGDELCPGRRFGTMQRLTIDGRHSGRQRAGKR